MTNEYTPIKDCYTCLEHFLLYTDFGFSEATSAYLAGLYHVAETKDVRFPELAQVLLRSRVGPRIEP